MQISLALNDEKVETEKSASARFERYHPFAGIWASPASAKKCFSAKKLKNEISNKMCLVRVSRDVGISLMLQQTGNI